MASTHDVFDQLAPLLVKAIPEVVASMPITRPICILRIVYYDTHAPEAYINLSTMTEHRRKRLVEVKGRDALYYIWASAEEMCDGPGGHLGTRDAGGDLAPLFGQVYALLAENEKTYMESYRQMLQRVSRELNTQDWSRISEVTDDFVVLPADGSQFFDDDFHDIRNSISDTRLELLRSRGLLGPGRRWDRFSQPKKWWQFWK